MLNYSLVPNQTPDSVDPLVFKYLEDEFAKLSSKNKLSIENLHGGKPWMADPNHWNYVAAKKATEVCAHCNLALKCTSQLLYAFRLCIKFNLT